MKSSNDPIRTPSRREALSFALCGLLAVSVACEEDGPFGRDDEVATVAFTSLDQNLEMGFTTHLEFEIRDADGDPIDPDDVTIDFSTSDETIAIVSETGLVTPIGLGSADISIEVGSVVMTDTVRITVVQQISSVEFSDTELPMITGETLSLEFRVLDPEGDLVLHPVRPTFTSSNPAVASVSVSGAVTGESVGTATITVIVRTRRGTGGSGASATIEIPVFAASSGGISLVGSPFATQVDVGFVINELAVVRDGAGISIPDAELVFATTDAAVATVDAAGLLTAAAPGETLITVTSPDATGSATFRLRVLTARSIHWFEVSPPSLSGVSVGQSWDFGAVVGTDPGEIRDFLATYSSSDETVVTVHPLTGVVTFVGPGTATITGRNGDLTAESVIHVSE